MLGGKEKKMLSMIKTKSAIRFTVLLISVLTLPQILHAATSVSKDGIVWTFDKDYTVGQFANGDYWVVGPVKVTSTTATGGSMVNPTPGTQAYASSLSGNFVQYVSPVAIPEPL